jgi:5'-deoxynucleotidase YfbR-like HD superfamily hydrolase
MTSLEPGMSREAQLAALLHDAPEYVIGDLISPFKAAIGLDYKAFEERLLAAIHARFRLPHPLWPDLKASIKRADRIAAYHEATQLAGFDENEGRTYFGPVEILTETLTAALLSLEPLSVAEAEKAFLDRFTELGSA